MSNRGELNPTDTPLSAVLANLAEQGWSGHFAVRPQGRIECLSCRRTDDAARYHANEVTRLEGTSDPDDMVMVAPLCCDGCSTKGTLVLAYGPEASEEDSDVLLTLDRTPGEASRATRIGGATPGVR